MKMLEMCHQDTRVIIEHLHDAGLERRSNFSSVCAVLHSARMTSKKKISNNAIAVPASSSRIAWLFFPS